jgi:hypothetical protein
MLDIQCRKIRCIDWIARVLCYWCPSAGDEDDPSYQRTTTQHTTTTDGRSVRGLIPMRSRTVINHAGSAAGGSNAPAITNQQRRSMGTVVVRPPINRERLSANDLTARVGTVAASSN